MCLTQHVILLSSAKELGLHISSVFELRSNTAENLLAVVEKVLTLLLHTEKTGNNIASSVSKRRKMGLKKKIPKYILKSIVLIVLSNYIQKQIFMRENQITRLGGRY